MAVLIRELMENGKEKKLYKSSGEKVSNEKVKDADKLDGKIKAAIEKIEKEIEERGLLELKSKRGEVTKLYHFIGSSLIPLIDNLKISKGDRQYIWSAINYHAKLKELKVDESNERLKRDPVTSSWKYYYNLGKYDWEDVKEFDWTQWSEIFDSKLTTYDQRIIPWLIEKKKKFFKEGSLQNWFRALMRELRNYLKGYETTILTKKELNSELDLVFEKFKKSYKT